MLILIRIWGQSTPNILPTITPSAGKFCFRSVYLSICSLFQLSFYFAVAQFNLDLSQHENANYTRVLGDRKEWRFLRLSLRDRGEKLRAA